jgi:hypothetical protein
MPVPFSRRDLVLAATTAMAVFGLDGSLAIVEAKQRQRTPDPKQGYLHFKVGDAEVTALYDGVWEKVHNPAYFSNATVQETKQALAAAGCVAQAFIYLPRDRVCHVDFKVTVPHQRRWVGGVINVVDYLSQYARCGRPQAFEFGWICRHCHLDFALSPSSTRRRIISFSRDPRAFHEILQGL